MLSAPPHGRQHHLRSLLLLLLLTHCLVLVLRL
jgi:hypothetical protein